MQRMREGQEMPAQQPNVRQLQRNARSQRPRPPSVNESNGTAQGFGKHYHITLVRRVSRRKNRENPSPRSLRSIYGTNNKVANGHLDNRDSQSRYTDNQSVLIGKECPQRCGRGHGQITLGLMGKCGWTDVRLDQQPNTRTRDLRNRSNHQEDATNTR